MATTKYIINNLDGNLSAQTISGILSATTYYGDGSNLSGVETSFIEEVTYNQLWDKITNSGFTTGKEYKITDFQTNNFLHGQYIADQEYSTQNLSVGSLDPNFKNYIGFNDGVHAIKEVELGSWFLTGSCQIKISPYEFLTIGTSDFTIEWFQYYQGDRANNSRPFSIGQYPTAFIGMSFESGPINYFWWNQNGIPYTFTLNTPIENTWSHFVVQRSGTTINIFQDGQIVYTGTHGEDLQNNDDLIIGNESNGGPKFEGYMTNFRWTAGRAVYDGPFDPITKPLNPEDDTVMLFKTMSNLKMFRCSSYNESVSAGSYGVDYVAWDKFTPFESERKIYCGGYFSMYEDDYCYHIARLNQDGTLDKTFKTYGPNYSVSSGFSDVVKCIEIQDDGKILVGGNFSDYNNQYCGYLVRLLEDGTQDPDFDTSNAGNGFNGTVRTIVPMSDLTMMVGGSFNSYTDFDNGSTAVHNICKLYENGFIDRTYVENTGFGFNNSVYVITPIDYVTTTPYFYVGGDFTQWTDPLSGTINVGRIIKLDYQWQYYSNFNVQNGGFNKRIFDIALQSNGQIIVVGGVWNQGKYTQYTYLGTAYTANSIIRLDAFGAVDETFLTNTGTGFDAPTYSVDILDDDRIVVGGIFSSFDGTSSTRLVYLNYDGTIDNTQINTFKPGSDVIKVKKLADGNVLIGGWFGDFSFGSGHLGYIAKYTTNVQPSGFVYSGVNTGTIEKLIVKASSESTLEPIAYSEEFPQDIIEYNPYAQNLGTLFYYYNGQILPDSSMITGLDLQWDGSRVYFDMPSGYNIALGRSLYINASFEYDDLELHLYVNSAIPNKTQISTQDNYSTFYNSVYSRVTISNDGTRVYLDDLDFANYTAYDPDSLSLTTEMPVYPIKGQITNRQDTSLDVSVPFDFRNVKYRRYEMILSCDTFSFETDYTGLYDNYNLQFLNASGRNRDYFSIGDRGINYQNIKWNKTILSNYSDNNVIRGEFKVSNINHKLYGNTILTDFTYNDVDIMEENVIYNMNKNILKGNLNGNLIKGSFFNNYVSDYFTGNEIAYDFYSNNVKDGCNNNKFYNTFFGNNIGINFVGNMFNYTYYNTFGGNFNSNKFYSSLYNCTFASSNIGNVFSGITTDLITLTQSFNYNNVRNEIKKITIKCQVDSYDFGLYTNDSIMNNDANKDIIRNTSGTKYYEILSGTSMVYLELGV